MNNRRQIARAFVHVIKNRQCKFFSAVHQMLQSLIRPHVLTFVENLQIIQHFDENFAHFTDSPHKNYVLQFHCKNINTTAQAIHKISAPLT